MIFPFDVQSIFLNLPLRIAQRVFMGFKSGEFSGQSNTCKLFFLETCFSYFDIYMAKCQILLKIPDLSGKIF